MTDEMLELARRNQREAGVENVEFLKGTIEDDPAARRLGRRDHLQLRDQPLRRQAAGLPRGGAGAAAGRALRRHATSSPTRTWTRRPARDMQQWTGCIAGALTARRVRARARRPPASRRSRSRRPTASTTRRRSAIIRARLAGAMTTAEIQLNDPQTLYRRWEDSQWSPFEIDLDARPRAVGGDGRGRPRASSTGRSSSLMVAEERITTKFSGLVGAHGSEEEATFLSTQQVDEARHMQFYARFQRRGDRRARAIAAHVERAREQVSPAFRGIFDEALVEAHERLVAAPGDLAAKVRFVTIYHLILESTLGLTSFRFITRYLDREGLLPGSSRATRRSTTTRPATSATASGSCASPCAQRRGSRRRPRDAARAAAARWPSR